MCVPADDNTLKEKVMRSVAAYIYRYMENRECMSRFRENGPRPRRRFFECMPFYLTFLGKSLDDVHREMEDYDWSKVRSQGGDGTSKCVEANTGQNYDDDNTTDEHESAEDVSQIDEVDQLIMRELGLKTKAELNAYYDSIAPSPKYMSSKGKAILEVSGRDGENGESDGEFQRKLEQECEDYLAKYGGLGCQGLPDSQWKKNPRKTAQPTTRALSPVAEDDEETEITKENLVKMLKEKIEIKPRASIRHATTASSEGDAEKGWRYTTFDKARMPFWQAEGLYMTMKAQEKIEEGWDVGGDLIKRAGWTVEFEWQYSLSLSYRG